MKKGILLILAITLAASTGCKSKNDAENEIEQTTEVTQEEETSKDALADDKTELDTEAESDEQKEPVIEKEEETEESTEETVDQTVNAKDVFNIPKGKENIKTSTFSILNSYNAFSVTWDGERKHTYYKLYASSTVDGNYGYIKDIQKIDPETSGLLNYSVTLENFNLDSNVYLKITSITEKDGDEVEEPYGPILHYASKSASELTNEELTHYLTLKYPVIMSEDQSVAFRFTDRYLIEENDDEIRVVSNLKGEYIGIFDKAMKSEYRDEILKSIEDIYLYVYEIRAKKIVGIVEDKLTITINDPEHIVTEFDE